MVALKGSGVDLIAQERNRQVRKGWNDAENIECELAQCAAEIICNALEDRGSQEDSWAPERAARVRVKYKDSYRRRLVIAGALIAAEIDRLGVEEAEQLKRGGQTDAAS